MFQKYGASIIATPLGSVQLGRGAETPLTIEQLLAQGWEIAGDQSGR